MLPGQCHHGVQGRAGHLKVIPQAVVALVHQTAKSGRVIASHGVRGLQRPRVLGHNMARAAHQGAP
ncbi:MAG: hypothetical protein Q7U96_04160 [Chloroflexota bacterium]|nr:hypothetical protein [Chloroflexota bacterium]